MYCEKVFLPNSLLFFQRIGWNASINSTYVSEVIPNVGGKDSKIAILGVDPDYIVIGSDWESKDYYSQMMFSREWLDEQGIELLYVPYTEAISTTEIKRRINS